ncbi:MAG: hypothetical protein JW953_21565 [Anaerolineae bacterium]|nr:hypothetical protein [Anaerolineae bacterium]
MRQRWWVFGSIVIATLSFVGLRYVINNLWPDPDVIWARPQLLLFAFMFLGLSAGAVPISTFLNNRFAQSDWFERDKIRLVRQGTWVGFLGVLLAYLQLIKALNWTIVAVLAGVFVLIETFFLTRE